MADKAAGAESDYYEEEGTNGAGGGLVRSALRNFIR